MAESTVRLEGVINHVLRRRILRSERQIIPKSLRKDDSPTMPGTGFAVPASFLPQQQGYGGWQMSARPGMPVMPIIAGWIFHPGGAGQQMPGWQVLGSTDAEGAIRQPGAALEGAQALGDAAVHATAPDCSGPAAAGGAPPVFILPEASACDGRAPSLAGCAGRAPSLATRCPSTATRCSSTVAGGLPEAAERTSSAATRKRKAAAVAPTAADADLLAKKSPKSSKSPETTNTMSTVEQALLLLQAHEDELKRKERTIQAVLTNEEKESDGAEEGFVGIFSEQTEHNWWGVDFARTSSFHRTSSSAGISTSELLRNASPFIRNFCRTSSTVSRVDGMLTPVNTGTTPGFARTSSGLGANTGFARTSSGLGFARTSSGLARTASSALMRTYSSAHAAAAAPFGRTQSGAAAESGSITPANALALLSSLEKRASVVSGTGTPKDDLFALPIERTSSTFARTSSGFGFARTSSSGTNKFGRTQSGAFGRTQSGVSSSFGRTQSGVSAGLGFSTPTNALTPVITPRDDFGRTASSIGVARAPKSCAQLSSAAGTSVLGALSTA